MRLQRLEVRRAHLQHDLRPGGLRRLPLGGRAQIGALGEGRYAAVVVQELITDDAHGGDTAGQARRGDRSGRKGCIVLRAHAGEIRRERRVAGGADLLRYGVGRLRVQQRGVHARVILQRCRFGFSESECLGSLRAG